MRKLGSRIESTVNSRASIGDFQRLMRNLNCGLNAAMSSAAKFYDSTREVRAIGILRFSLGRLIPFNSTGREGRTTSISKVL